MEVVLEMCPIFARKLKLVLGKGIRQECRNFLLRPLLVSVVKIWRLFCKRGLYLYKKYYMILNLVLDEGIRLEPRNLLFRSLLVSVVKI